MLKKIIKPIFHCFASVCFLFAAIPTVLIKRLKYKNEHPSVLFGITPLINIKYWSQSLRKKGYHSISFVYSIYAINKEDDFDYVPQKVFPKLSNLLGPIFSYIQEYLCCLWAMKNFDIFVLDFDGGFLKSSPIRYFEFQLYRLAKKKIIALPYGSDAIDLRLCRDRLTLVSILRDYPNTGINAKRVERRVTYYSKWANYIICCSNMIDYLPKYDLLMTSYLCIDTDKWQPDEGHFKHRKSVEISRPFRVLHAPNHRAIKGTEYLVKACDELKREGINIELLIKERVPNDEIREVMKDVDVVASAFIMGYYELFALEGMSMGKPVLNYWRPDLKLIYSIYSYASECPILDTPLNKIKDNLLYLYNNPDVCVELGMRGRQYVEKYHSFDAIGETFDKIIREIWNK